MNLYTNGEYVIFFDDDMVVCHLTEHGELVFWYTNNLYVKGYTIDF